MGQCDACLEMKRMKANGADVVELREKKHEHDKLHS